MDVIESVEFSDWYSNVPAHLQVPAMDALERGSVLFFPSLGFEIRDGEAELISERFASGRAKNISFDSATGLLRGTNAGGEHADRLKSFVSRFAEQSKTLVRNLLPRYAAAIQLGRTSFRPVEVNGRPSSPRKDDTRLHVDAFPATPVQGRRILRLFSNVNPRGQDRVWRVGEPFESVADRFLRRARRQFWGEAAVLRALRVTKSRRTHYDHVMLELHNRMKGDTRYQAAVEHVEICFPAGSTWLVFTDRVSHAAIAGQHCLEQTFYLPVNAMADPSRSPLRVLERLCGGSLV